MKDPKSYVSERYAQSAKRQSDWWWGMSDEERDEWRRKQRAGIARLQPIKQRPKEKQEAGVR